MGIMRKREKNSVFRERRTDFTKSVQVLQKTVQFIQKSVQVLQKTVQFIQKSVQVLQKAYSPHKKAYCFYKKRTVHTVFPNQTDTCKRIFEYKSASHHPIRKVSGIFSRYLSYGYWSNPRTTKVHSMRL
jgi:hypothetical protein